MCAAWGFAALLIGLGAILDSYWIGQFGIGGVGMGAALLVMRDNARTRRQLRRQSVPDQRGPVRHL